MLEPLDVWKVELAVGKAAHDVPGTLTIGDGGLEFIQREEGTSTTIHYERIARVKRLRVSSVLLIHWHEGGVERRTAFYLVKPPPLEPGGRAAAATTPEPGPFFMRRTKRGQQRRNSYYLASTGTELKPTLVAWVEEVRERTQAAKS